MQPPRVNPYEAPQAPLRGTPLPEWRAPQNILHTADTAAEGKAQLRDLLITALFVVVLQGAVYYFWPTSRFYLLFFFALELPVLGLVSLNARRDIRLRGTFVCELNEHRLRCVCPNSWAGETFTLELSNLERIDDRRGADSACYLWNKAGEKFWLTDNYDNPVDELVDELRFRLENRQQA